jgi:L-aspartate oxidase
LDSIPAKLSGQPVVIGAGLAGLMTALHLAPEPVILLAKAPLGSGAASVWAQGGIAAALGHDDAPALHAADTIAAGDGLCDRRAVERITGAAHDAVAALLRHGVVFDRDASGAFYIGLEAAHSRRRILHARGDATGREIMRALVAAVRRTATITVLEGVEARRLLVHDGRIAGVLAIGPAGPLLLPTARLVIATGGLGGLYRETTNPLAAVGQGLALAAGAGAVLADMEFVQFHPTALDVGLDPMPLVSEAVRGEGAVLIDETGERFMASYNRADLEPRDVVAHAVWRRLAERHRVFLDARSTLGARFAERFPNIAAKCRAAGLDPEAEPIPVRPAAHYHMGGIAVDEAGRSSIDGLWACGEAAATGLHGANRLASNSLLEAAASARWVADSIAGAEVGRLTLMQVVAVPPSPEVGLVRENMSEKVGVVRDRAGLTVAIEALQPLAFGGGPTTAPALIGLFIATAALLRPESRGGHCRIDFPAHSSERAHRSYLRLRGAEIVAHRDTADRAPLALGG